MRNAASLVRAGAGAVKLEGGRKRVDAVQAILDTEIPVMGHIGLTPQSVHALGGFKVQGKELDAAQAIIDDAVALAEAGCFAIVLECVPDAVARMVTESVPVPTIGIGAGRHCDGQVLVWHDLLGFEADGHADPSSCVRTRSSSVTPPRAIEQFCADVRAGTFPSSAETYHMTDRWPRRSVSTARARPSPSSPSSEPVSTRRAARGRGRAIAFAVGRRNRDPRGALADRAATRRARRAPLGLRESPAAAPFAGYPRGDASQIGGRAASASSSPTPKRRASAGLRGAAPARAVRRHAVRAAGRHRHRVHDVGCDRSRSTSTWYTADGLADRRGAHGAVPA